eukprot:TRINITY_DN103782_c0_g1_i1.p1 TRINITY_DN103782_c0_g1~~TRINITY_DN103782_c0_g1_i1.p1  ORF type:complete len:417 (+),score=38.90 TRINITY_DN103782_c0_g1_i1:32-1282(+)
MCSNDGLPPLQLFDDNNCQTFKYHTLTVRMPRVASNVIEQNTYLTEDQKRRVQELISELEGTGKGICRAVAQPLGGGTKEEAELFHCMDPWLGKEWVHTPWLYGEVYFYHRLYECVDYHTTKKDPFGQLKKKSVNDAQQLITQLLQHYNTQTKQQLDHHSAQEIGKGLMYSSLWGNKMDLSRFLIDDASRQDTTHNADNVLCDHINMCWDHIVDHKGKSSQMDVILDNMGFELFTDLVLVSFLIDQNYTTTVHLHCKPYPYYVSDATKDDVHWLLQFLCEHEESAVSTFGKHFACLIDGKQVILHDDPFWCSPMEFRHFPQHLKSHLETSTLTFVKGDLNYRKLIDDRHWNYNTPFKQIIEGYPSGGFPSPVCALRTLKCELVCDVSDAKVEAAAAKDKDWLVSSQWGVAQFWKRT